MIKSFRHRKKHFWKVSKTPSKKLFNPRPDRFLSRTLQGEDRVTVSRAPRRLPSQDQNRPNSLDPNFPLNIIIIINNNNDISDISSSSSSRDQRNHPPTVAAAATATCPPPPPSAASAQIERNVPLLRALYHAMPRKHKDILPTAH